MIVQQKERITCQCRLLIEMFQFHLLNLLNFSFFFVLTNWRHPLTFFITLIEESLLTSMNKTVADKEDSYI